MPILGAGNSAAAQILGRERVKMLPIPSPGRVEEAPVPRAPNGDDGGRSSSLLHDGSQTYKDSSQEGLKGANHGVEGGGIR
jgi:hypothetical protein